MGYYTDYELSASYYKTDNNGTRTEVVSIPELVLGCLEKEIDKMNIFEGGSISDTLWASAKWYDWEEDMLLLSKRFPDVLFYLHGDGENSTDLWDAYFLGGKVQHCPAEIKYDDFDPLKLSSVDGSDKIDSYSYE